MGSYLETVESVYAAAAATPDSSLCCTTAARWHLPDLVIPPRMLAMNYGCGSIVDPRDLRPGDKLLYVGVGGGLEALQLAYFLRQPSSVITVDPVSAMREAARDNFEEAARLNPWFRPEFIELLDGSALSLPVERSSVRLVSQNCLFNIFARDDLERALAEVVRVLQPGGVFTTSDPITPVPLPAELTTNEQLRARCLSGCQTFSRYVQLLTEAGFGRVEVRARFPYRYLHPTEYPALSEPVLLESIELAAFKVPDGPDGPACFTGRTATYCGTGATWSDERSGQVLYRGIPVEVSDAAADRLAQLPDILVTDSTWHSRGGCC